MEDKSNIKKQHYADIIIDISHEQVDRSFQYLIPDFLLSRVTLGSCVLVPFGRSDGKRKGYVIGISDTAVIESSKIKSLVDIADDERDAKTHLIRLASWIKKRYGSTMIQALKSVLPARKKIKPLVEKSIILKISEDEAKFYIKESLRKKYFARQRLLCALLEAEAKKTAVPYSYITSKLHISAPTVKALEKLGIVEIISENVYRDPTAYSLCTSEKKGLFNKETSDFRLNTFQQTAVDRVISDYDNKKFNTYLLHGVTGSGKTEVYIGIIEEVIKRGRQAIVLIPEISLTYQTLMRFYGHFGKRVSFMNSALSGGEKSDQFRRAENGDIDVMIGPRSALFTPFSRLGLIVIDEEHELSYKSDQTPKYHSVDTAIALASFIEDGASVILGSATPSLESYYKAETGEYILLELQGRAGGSQLPETHIADMRKELLNGNRSIFSDILKEKIWDGLEKGEQTMLFLNRRGLSGFVSCRSCGYVFKCPHCDVSLSEHTGGKLVCHYCGYNTGISNTCPECGSKYVSAFKAGTQRIARETLKLFPKARIIRMDADTTGTKHSYEKILSAFANHEADILVGTQMIVKGHDFPDVTLVGIIAADLSLNASDFHAAERTYCLITQAAGRAGRGDKKGSVIIQSYRPEHYAIRSGAAQDYKAFFEEEMSYRKLLNYPPYSHFLCIQFFGNEEDRLLQITGIFAEKIKSLFADNKKTALIGPAPAGIAKIDDVYRFVIYVKNDKIDILQQITDYCNTIQLPQNISVQYDMDPVRSF